MQNKFFSDFSFVSKTHVPLLLESALKLLVKGVQVVFMGLWCIIRKSLRIFQFEFGFCDLSSTAQSKAPTLDYQHASTRICRQKQFISASHNNRKVLSKQTAWSHKATCFLTISHQHQSRHLLSRMRQELHCQNDSQTTTYSKTLLIWPSLIQKIGWFGLVPRSRQAYALFNGITLSLIRTYLSAYGLNHTTFGACRALEMCDTEAQKPHVPWSHWEGSC